MTNRLESPNLLLTLAQFADVNDVLRGVRESLKEFSPWLGWAVPDYNLKHAQEFIQSAIQGHQQGKNFHYILRAKGGGFVGCAGLLHEPDCNGKNVPIYEIGYWVRTPDAAKGFASEAARVLADHALTNLKAQRVEISCHANNLASAKVAQNAGFTQEARLKNHRLNADGTLADTLIFARFPS